MQNVRNSDSLILGHCCDNLPGFRWNDQNDDFKMEVLWFCTICRKPHCSTIMNFTIDNDVFSSGRTAHDGWVLTSCHGAIS